MNCVFPEGDDDLGYALGSLGNRRKGLGRCQAASGDCTIDAGNVVLSENVERAVRDVASIAGVSGVVTVWRRHGIGMRC